MFLIRTDDSVDVGILQAAAEESGGCFQPNYDFDLTPEEIAALTESANPSGTSTTSGTIGVFDSAGNEIVIGVIDTGYYVKMQGPKSLLWVNTDEAGGSIDEDKDGNGFKHDLHGINAISATMAVGPPPYEAGELDDGGFADHGTRVAMIASGYCGPDPGAAFRVLPCRAVEASFASDDFLMCMRYLHWIDQKKPGVVVAAINSSFQGVYEPDDCEIDTIEELRDAGILFVGATGLAKNSQGEPFYPAEYKTANVIAVASMTDVVNSSDGASATHVAASVGDRDWPSWNGATPLACESMILSTPSFAAPQVSNLAARLRAAIPGDEWWQRRNRILTGGELVEQLEEITLSGRRVPHENRHGASSSLGTFSACTGRSVRGRILPRPEVGATVAAGGDLPLIAYDIDCAGPAGPVGVLIRKAGCADASCESRLDLRDSGPPDDEVEGDGRFEGKWTAPTDWTSAEVRFWAGEPHEELFLLTIVP